MSRVESDTYPGPPGRGRLRRRGAKRPFVWLAGARGILVVAMTDTSASSGDRPRRTRVVAGSAVGVDGRLAQVREWVAVRPGGLVVLALLIGVGAGLGAVLFRYMILWVTELATGRAAPSIAGRVGNPHLPRLGVGYLLFVPVIGGLLYGPLVARLRLRRGGMVCRR